MSDFNTRFAQLADKARAMEGGQALGRAMMALAGEVDGYLEQQRAAYYAKASGLLTKWLDFHNQCLSEAYNSNEQETAILRRQLAQRLAADERWTAGYAEALDLMTK